MLTMVEPSMILEEKLSKHFGNPASIDSQSSCPFGKESHQRRDDPDPRMLGKYNKYTHLTVSCEKIYQDCINTEFQKVGIRPLYPFRETFQTKKIKICLLP